MTASRNLRVKKVCSYVADKLELHAASRAPSISDSSDGVPSPRQPSNADDPAAPKPVDFIPEEELEILVGNVLLPLHVTLATARAYYWKTGGDLVVSYRRKSLAL